MSKNSDGAFNTEEGECGALLTQIEEVTAKIEQRISLLLAHPSVPCWFKDKLEMIGGEVK